MVRCPQPYPTSRATVTTTRMTMCSYPPIVLRRKPCSMAVWQRSRGELPSDRRIQRLRFQRTSLQNRDSLMIHLVRKTHNLQIAPPTPPPHCSPRGNTVQMPPAKLKPSYNGMINNHRCIYCVVTSVDLRCVRWVLGKFTESNALVLGSVFTHSREHFKPTVDHPQARPGKRVTGRTHRA